MGMEWTSDLVGIKKELARRSPGGLLEAVPESEYGGLTARRLECIHRFARSNPIYHTSHRETISGVPVRVYEGDCNRYWLNSIQHDSSRAPFSPTWMASAYAMASVARSLGFLEVVDVGSGDGRIAHFARVCGMDACGIELDEMLTDLQKRIADSTGISYRTECTDAAALDYGRLGLTRPAFFIGGLAQMGGSELAGAVIDGIGRVPGLLGRSCVVLAGTHSAKYAPAPPAGWGSTIRSRGMDVIRTIELPTAWTMHEPQETPYIYCRFAPT